MPALVAAMVAFALLGSTMRTAVNDSDALATAGTIFAGVFVQALPFLAVGVLLSALIAVFVTPDRLARWLPKRPAAAVLVAAASGAALPGCECGSVPVARRLFGEGALGAAPPRPGQTHDDRGDQGGTDAREHHLRLAGKRNHRGDHHHRVDRRGGQHERQGRRTEGTLAEQPAGHRHRAALAAR